MYAYTFIIIFVIRNLFLPPEIKIELDNILYHKHLKNVSTNTADTGFNHYTLPTNKKSTYIFFELFGI